MDSIISTGKTPTPQDFGQIFNLVGGYRISQALYIAVELGIPGLLSSGPRHSDDLAAKTKTHAPTLYRILRFLAGAGLFNEIGPREFELTQLGSALRADIPGSICPAVRLWLSESHWLPWGHLLHCVRTGQHAFSHAHGMGVFDYLGKNADLSAVFNATMTTGSTRVGSAIVKHYDFSGIRKIVDVGGGHGFILATVLASNATMRGVLYDLPHVVALHDCVHDEPPLGIGGAHQSCANHVAHAARSSVAADDVLRPQQALPRLGCDFQSDFACVLFESVEPVLEENPNVREARETLQQSPFEFGLIEGSERGMSV